MTKQRKNNEGSIYEDRIRGGFRVQIRMPGTGKRITKRFQDYDSAERWKDEQMHRLGCGQFISPGDTTLGEWLLKWMKLYNLQNVRQRTFERNVSLIKHCDSIAHIKIQDLLPSHFQHLYLEMKQYSGETKKKVHNLLHQALDQAVNERIIQSNPIDSVKAPRVVRTEIETFTPQSLQRVLEAAKGHRWHPSLLLAATTGMRLGEVLGIRWQDVDLKAKEVYVQQTLQHANTGIIFEEPKTKASRRKISIPLPTVMAMEKLRASLGDIVLPESLCFTAGNGSPIQPKNYHRWWTDVQRKANEDWVKIKNKIATLKKQKKTEEDEYKTLLIAQKSLEKSLHKNFHVLRHTHATLLLANGVPVIEVSRRLGHSKTSITLDRYGHAIPGHDQIIAEQVPKIYGI